MSGRRRCFCVSVPFRRPCYPVRAVCARWEVPSSWRTTVALATTWSTTVNVFPRLSDAFGVGEYEILRRAAGREQHRCYNDQLLEHLSSSVCFLCLWSAIRRNTNDRDPLMGHASRVCPCERPRSVHDGSAREIGRVAEPVGATPTTCFCVASLACAAHAGLFQAPLMSVIA